MQQSEIINLDEKRDFQVDSSNLKHVRSFCREVHHSLIFEDNKLKTWDRKLESSSNDDIEKKAKKLSKEK